jgi:N-acetyl-anhydromuramyl-L-alanine amidase AmpD
VNIVDITSKIPKTNYSTNRSGFAVNCIVLHITADKEDSQSINWFTDPNSGVSAHYVVGKTGKVYQVVKDENKAFHCGIVRKPSAQIYFDMGKVNPNLYTIGIELVSAGERPTDVQYASLLELVNTLCNKFGIIKARYHIIGHYQLDSIERANDPIVSYSVDRVVADINKPIGPTPEEIAKQKMVAAAAAEAERQRLLKERIAKIMSEVRIVFKDMIDENGNVHFSNDMVNFLFDKGIIKGRTDANGQAIYAPNSPITRGEAAVIVAKAMMKLEDEISKLK